MYRDILTTAYLLGGYSPMDLWQAQHRVYQAYRSSQRTKHPGSKRSNTPLRKSNRREYKRRQRARRN